MTLPPLAVIGPTASGKSDLAIRLAESEPGSALISGDAMAVYRGMDIGTATPAAQDLARVPHDLISVVEVDETFTLVDFTERARAAVASIEASGGTPILVGGTGLYVRSLVDDFDPPPQFPEVLARLDAEPDTAALWHRLADLDPAGAAKMEPSNRRRILRALEVTVGSGTPFSSFGDGVDQYPPTSWVQIGLRWDRRELDERIDRRIDVQLEAGWLDEVAALLDGPPWSHTAAQALGYGPLAEVVRGRRSAADAIDEIRRRTKKFARRQERWFRRDPRIHWLDADRTDLVERAADIWRRNPIAEAASSLRD